MSRSSSALWRWAAPRIRGATPYEEIRNKHLDTCAFIDAVHVASKVLRALLPLAQGAARMRHFLRGSQMPPLPPDGGRFLKHWNSSHEFSEGADCAYGSLLSTLWQHNNEPLPQELRKLFGMEVQKRVTEMREATVDTKTILVVSTVLFEGLHGPPSLEHVRDMDFSALRSLRKDDTRLAAFQHDTFRGSQLRLDLAAVAEAERQSINGSGKPRHRLRRADRLQLECNFNLHDGIASPFRIVNFEELLAEEQCFEMLDRDDEE